MYQPPPGPQHPGYPNQPGQPNQPGYQPQAPGQPAAHAQPPTPGPQPTKLGLIVGALWLMLGLAGALITAIMAITQSEQTAVDVSMVGLPLFFSGVVAMLVAPFVRKKSKGAAIGAPIGCGCGTLLFGIAGMVLFFAAIWPAL